MNYSSQVSYYCAINGISESEQVKVSKKEEKQKKLKDEKQAKDSLMAKEKELYDKVLKEKQEVWFYRDKEVPYGCFSNFSRHPIEYDGKIWPTTEHYFQAQKFPSDPDLMEKVRMAHNSMEAAAIGRNRSLPRRNDWDSIKDEIMYKIVLAKFEQHKDIQEVLLSTGNMKLVEHTHLDNYWADGGDGTGRNQLGVTLMRVRETIRNKLGQ
eukprot:TRINITY_DN75_c0_g1_i2.p1 TRINITY_DN75_c0_g1~~TRINITY_DN75_c0_g1_i2.p1  ORF type:complete len:210 (-),score=31.74 TRINITY_DN75_c0_g1_i2:58-687(-)